MKKIILLSFLIIGTLVLSGCSLSGGTQKNTPSTIANQNTTPVPPTEANTINIQNFSFSPSALTITKGTTITWTNNDSAPHQIKSSTFNSNSLSQGQSFSFTFDTVGTFDYSCAIHPSMTGKITVE